MSSFSSDSPPLSFDSPQFYPEYLSLPNIYTCSTCSFHLSAQQHQLSDQFQGKFGVGYLMDMVTNVNLMTPKDVILMTGKHTTCEVKCKGCMEYVGWKYLKADSESNQYKVDKFVLEKGKMRVVECWKED